MTPHTLPFLASPQSLQAGVENRGWVSTYFILTSSIKTDRTSQSVILIPLSSQNFFKLEESSICRQFITKYMTEAMVTTHCRAKSQPLSRATQHIQQLIFSTSWGIDFEVRHDEFEPCAYRFSFALCMLIDFPTFVLDMLSFYGAEKTRYVEYCRKKYHQKPSRDVRCNNRLSAPHKIFNHFN